MKFDHEDVGVLTLILVAGVLVFVITGRFADTGLAVTALWFIYLVGKSR